MKSSPSGIHSPFRKHGLLEQISTIPVEIPMKGIKYYKVLLNTPNTEDNHAAISQMNFLTFAVLETYKMCLNKLKNFRKLSFPT